MSTQESDLTFVKLEKSLEKDRAQRLETWFREKLLPATDVRLSSLTAPSGGAGFSGDTYIATLNWRDGSDDKEQKFVLRAELGAANCPESDFSKMVGLQKILGDIPGLPVPKVYWSESDSAVLGGPFYVMHFSDGRVAPDSPPFAAEGWVKDATPDERRIMYQSGVDFLVKLHKLDWRALNMEFLMHKGTGATQTRRHLDLVIGIYDRAMKGKRSALASDAIRWLEEHVPATENLCATWGDARLGNMLWRDYHCVAVLDWEMCTLAEPASDIAWWTFIERAFTEGRGVKLISGMPSRDELVAMYETTAGKKLENFPYHEVFNGFRGLAIVTHMGKVWEKAGQQLFGPPGWEDNNPVTNTFRELMAGYL